MFAFLLGFYDENPTIYLIVCCLALLLWIYFMYMELCTLNACDQHRLDMSLLRQQKTKTPTISSDLMCKEIAWIKGKSWIWYADVDLAKIYNSLILSLSRFLYYVYIISMQISHLLFAQCQTNATDFPQILQQILQNTSLAAHHWHGLVLRTSQHKCDSKIPASMVISFNTEKKITRIKCTFLSFRTIDNRIETKKTCI